MSFRWYPIYQKGNPQLRVFLPNFWMKLVKPKEKLPPNVVQFHVPLEMTEYDVKNYLEKIYKVPVACVAVEIKNGPVRKSLVKRNLLKGDDYKLASVTLTRGETFTFPEIDTDVTSEISEKLDEQSKKKFESVQEQIKNRPGLPGWFMQ